MKKAYRKISVLFGAGHVCHGGVTATGRTKLTVQNASSLHSTRNLTDERTSRP